MKITNEKELNAGVVSGPLKVRTVETTWSHLHGQEWMFTIVNMGKEVTTSLQFPPEKEKEEAHYARTYKTYEDARAAAVLCCNEGNEEDI